MKKETLLEVNDLQKIYHSAKKEAFTAVDGISFEVYKGECFGLLGPNGAGKSTAMKCITGFYPLSRGKVLIRDINVHKEPKSARQKLGVCSQDDTLDTDFSVIEQMVTYASYFGIDKHEAKQRADSLLKRFDLDIKASEDVEALSGGMRRRLQVARALISYPEVLILDEPTTGLDPEVRRELWDIITENKKIGISILLSTHYMEEAERLCDRVAIMHKGKILDCDSPQELIKKHIGCQEVKEELRPGIVWKRLPNLEDVYMRLTGRGLDKDL